MTTGRFVAGIVWVAVLLLSFTVKQGTTTDFVFQLQSSNVSFNNLQKKLNTNVNWSPDKCPGDLQNGKYSCSRGKCDAGPRSANQYLQCYCDSLCQELEDCCYDYPQKCTPLTYWKETKSSDPPLSCVDMGHKIWNGYVLVSGCSIGAHGNVEMVRRCRAGKQDSDIISGIPVFDMSTNVSYQNVYCAKCNNATSLGYWNFQLDCKKNPTYLINDTAALLEYARANCTQVTNPTKYQLPHNKPCIVKDKLCKPQLQSETMDLVYRLCNMYSLLLYGTHQKTKNPHCAICRNMTVNLGCTHAAGMGPSPALIILFDFKSSSKYQYSVYSPPQFWGRIPKKTYRESSESFHCEEGFAFDPVGRKCQELPKPQITHPASLQNDTNVTSSSNSTYFQGQKCTLLIYNMSQVTFLQNGSIFIPLLNQHYINGSYIVKTSHVIVCQRKTTRPIPAVNASLTALQILTYIGLSISILSELVLLVIYSCVKELRNIPGRILMCLLSSLVVYQALLLLSNLNDIRELCIAMAVLLHFFILVSFCWMAVMAYDVMKTFALKGPKLGGFSSRLFIKYCCFAYGTPLIIVLTALILDQTGVVRFGYGSYYCWLSNAFPLIFVMHVPVGIVLLFNIIALGITIVSIERTKRSTRIVRVGRGVHSPSLCIKLAVVLGATWIFGLISGYTENVALDYIHVILNSFQGLFILVVYVSNKRTVKLVKEKYSTTATTSQNSSSSAPYNQHFDLQRL